ncbi:REM2-like protein [Mya arenaria]|uniref:REM2-like protein n=1 Tax=Mya arenaria TaxID=6604 RepID=A0ABY7EVG6_MYAAR|nr:GTP-binding protein RAD-like [Mya arenaria]WAR13285.1 REM2-like protein [Mya arenaria]
MELAELCRLSDKYAMEDKSVRPKVVLERKGLTYTRSIRKKGEKRPQRSRSKSLPSIAITLPTKAFPHADYDTSLADIIQNSDCIPEELEQDSGRIRQFSTTMKGLVNKGDLCKDSRRDSGCSTTSYRRLSSISISSVCGSYGRRDSVYTEDQKRRNSSFASTYCTPVRRTSCITARECRRLGLAAGFGLDSSQESVLDECPSEYKVLVIGGSGVGKSAIVSQFTTSEFLGASDVQTDAVEQRTSVSVILNQEESVLELIEENSLANLNDAGSEKEVDAFMLVYSCADRGSFRSAQVALRRLREETGRGKPVMIVANKVDLARKRQVSQDEGKNLANSYNCKYIETSAALNHNVDELLAGVLSQIRLLQCGQFAAQLATQPVKKLKQKGLTGTLKTALRGVFGMKQKVSSCENLYEI